MWLIIIVIAGYIISAYFSNRKQTQSNLETLKQSGFSFDYLLWVNKSNI